jgi:hypothetical protein
MCRGCNHCTSQPKALGPRAPTSGRTGRVPVCRPRWPPPRSQGKYNAHIAPSQTRPLEVVLLLQWAHAQRMPLDTATLNFAARSGNQEVVQARTHTSALAVLTLMSIVCIFMQFLLDKRRYVGLPAIVDAASNGHLEIVQVGSCGKPVNMTQQIAKLRVWHADAYEHGFRSYQTDQLCVNPASCC